MDKKKKKQMVLICLWMLCSIVCGQELFQTDLNVRWTTSEVHYALALREQVGASVYFSAVEDEPLPPVSAPGVVEIAYIDGMTESGAPVRMKKSVVPYAETQQWRLMVKMPAKSQAVVSWTASSTGRTALIYEKGRRLHAMPLEVAGELLLANPADTSASLVVYIEILKSEEEGMMHLLPGWNLVSFMYKPDRNDEEAFLEMGAWRYDENVNAYVRADAIEAGGVYWLFTRESRIFRDSGEGTSPVRTLRQGWNLLGVAEEKTLPTDGYCAFFWKNGHWILTDTLKPGLGYWIHADAAGPLP